MSHTLLERSRRSAGDHRRRLPPAVGWLLAGLAVATAFGIRQLTGGADVNLPNALQDLFTLSFSVLIESVGFVVLGILLSVVVQLWLPSSWIVRALPRNAGLRRAVVSVLGVFLPVCECGNVPLARGLIVKGFSVSESMTFLVAAPILNPITIITTHQVFGFDDGILVARLLGGFAIANILGWLFSRHPHQDQLLTPQFSAQCAVPEDTHDHDHSGSRWTQSRQLFAREASAVMPALIIGSLIAGLVQVVIPREVFIALGSNPVWSVLALMALAFVISICSNIDAFFILPFAGIFMPGAIAAFLIFGPIIDIKMLAMMRTTFTTRTLVQLTAIVALVSLLIGLVMNYFA